MNNSVHTFKEGLEFRGLKKGSKESDYSGYLHYQQRLQLYFAYIGEHALLRVISQVLMIVLFDA